VSRYERPTASKLFDGNRSRVTYATEITGPEADTLGPEIGPEASGDFPEVLPRWSSEPNERDLPPPVPVRPR